MAVRVKRPSGRPSSLQNLIEMALVGVSDDLVEWMEQKGRVATGRSKRWRLTLNRIGESTPKDVVGNLIGVSYINYALFGRGAGLPPKVSTILRWMKVRGIRGRDILSGRFKTDRQGATAISKEIGRVGTKALRLSPILQDAIFTRNLKQASDKFTPFMAEETVDSLVDGFIEGIGDVKNIQVSVNKG